MHYQIFGLSQNFEISYRFSTRPNKLGQVGFFGLGSSQNTQWTQVDQVHVAMVPFGPDYVQSWLIKTMMLKKRRPVSSNTDDFIFTSALFPWVMHWCYWHNSFPNLSTHHQFQGEKKNTKGFGIGLKRKFFLKKKKKLFILFLLLFRLFLLLFMSPIALFGTIYGFHCTFWYYSWVSLYYFSYFFYLYLQYF